MELFPTVHFRTLACLLLALTLNQTALVAAAAKRAERTGERAAANTDESTKVVFSFLPNSLSKNPQLAMSVHTEFTDAGRRRGAPTAEHPWNYELFPGGARKIGSAAPGAERTPDPEEMMQLLRTALAKNNYLEATKTQRPTLLVIVHWGSYSALTDSEEDALAVTPGGEGNSESDPSTLSREGPTSGQVRRRELLERAELVGGPQFAKELAQALVERDQLDSATGALLANTAGGTNSSNASTGAAGSASATAAAFGSMVDPVYRFRYRDARTGFLMEQAEGSCYFVIASAFDYSGVAEGKKVLLWRTKMTVASNGVSQPQSLPPLVAAAAAHLGRETDKPVTLIRRVREGKVELGEPTVISYGDAAKEPASTAPAKK